MSKSFNKSNLVLCPRNNVGLSRSASVKDARKKPEAYCRRSRISDAADFMLPQERTRQNNWDTVLARTRAFFRVIHQSGTSMTRNSVLEALFAALVPLSH